MPGNRERVRVCRRSSGCRISLDWRPSRKTRGVLGKILASSGAGATKRSMASTNASCFDPALSKPASKRPSEDSAARFSASVPWKSSGCSLNVGTSRPPWSSMSSMPSAERRPLRRSFSKVRVWSAESPWKLNRSTGISFGYSRGTRLANSRSSGLKSPMPSAMSPKIFGIWASTGLYSSSTRSFPPMIRAPPSNPMEREKKEPKSRAVPTMGSATAPARVSRSERLRSTGRISSRVKNSFQKGTDSATLCGL
mmetsp:Transcript_2664/g.7687  ORF Transcript_2664/g.7687 Transcript_2664/m.7687 type:complete len:253 (-) Transcript_2664:685-1443(-)